MSPSSLRTIWAPIYAFLACRNGTVVSIFVTSQPFLWAPSGVKQSYRSKVRRSQVHTYICQPGAAVFAGFNIWIETCSNFLSYCPLHIFHVTPDCIRMRPLCQSQQLFTSEQMYVIIARTHLRALFATSHLFSSLCLAYFFSPLIGRVVVQWRRHNTPLTFFSAVNELKGCYDHNRGRGQLQKGVYVHCVSLRVVSNLLLMVVRFYMSILVSSTQINLTFSLY